MKSSTCCASVFASLLWKKKGATPRYSAICKRLRLNMEITSLNLPLPFSSGLTH